MTGISGNIMVWREALVQGPLFYQLDSELFWEMRSQFMEEAFGSKLVEYKRKVINEFLKLKRFQGREIVLWFEHDLFCQINMIAMLSYLLRNKKKVKISLVCVGDYPNSERRLGLGEISSDDYPKLFHKRTILEKSDLLLADRAWMYFCGKEIHKFESIQSTTFEYLGEALKNALQIFVINGEHSELEKEIILALNEEGMDKRKLISKLLREHNHLGFGDLQYEYIIRNIEKSSLTR
ncbi:hypothetical protein [Portibacter lacus]|nr:hypothetical protein [Portibacter lacus]